MNHVKKVYNEPCKGKYVMNDVQKLYSEPCQESIQCIELLKYSMTGRLLTQHHLEFLSLKGSYTGSSES